jgi:hypothetical protein
VPNPGGATNSALINTDAGCLVASGTYIKKGTTIKIHGLATVGGYCTLMAIDNHHTPATCDPYGTDYNAVDHLTLWKDGAVTGWVSSWQSWPHPQSFDTHDTGSTGPMNDTPDYGTHTYFHHSVNNISPNCPPTAPSGVDSIPPIEVNVVDCPPYFNTNDVGYVHHVLSGTTTEVYIPPSTAPDNFPAALATAVSDAVDNWNQALTTAGIAAQFHVTRTPCSTCIKIAVGSTSASCAESANWTFGSDGYSIIGSTITFSNDSDPTRNWASRGQLATESTAEHELGHHLGLGDNIAFSPSKTVMSYCSDTYTLTILNNDILPVQKTSFGGGTQDSCRE